MAQQTNKNTRIKDFIETPIDDSAALKLYSVPADTKMPSQFPGETCDNRVEAFEPSYSDREDGILGTYLHQIGKIPRLAPEEELRLFIKIGKYRKQTDECYRELATYFPDIDLDNPPSPAMLSQKIIAESLARPTEKYLQALVQHVTFMQSEIHAAKNCIVEANLRLAICIAKKYQERGLDLPDLIQEASIGLINAIDHFDWQRGVKFGAYASWWIQQAIGCAIANHGRTIRLPAYLLDEIRKVNRVEADFCQKGHYEPSREEVAEASGLPVEKIMQFGWLACDAISLDACVSHETGCEMGDLVACDQSPNPLTEIIRQNLTEEVEAALAALPQREKQIVSLRYGLEDGEEHSLQEIGTMLNLSRERIRQLEARALDRLRHPVRSDRLSDFRVA